MGLLSALGKRGTMQLRSGAMFGEGPAARWTARSGDFGPAAARRAGWVDTTEMMRGKMANPEELTALKQEAFRFVDPSDVRTLSRIQSAQSTDEIEQIIMEMSRG